VSKKRERGSAQADLNLTSANTLNTSLGMLYVTGPVSGTSLTLAGGAGTIYAASWTGGSIRAAFASTVVTTRGGFSPAVNLTGQRYGLSMSLLWSAGAIASPSITLAGPAGTVVAAGWNAGTFQATYVNSIIVRGSLAADLTLSGKNAAGNSLGLLSVTGLLDGAAVRARYGIGSVLAAGSRGSRVLAGLADRVTGLPAGTADFLAPADPAKPITIGVFMLTSAAGVFENSVVSAATLGTVVLRGVQSAAAAPFGLAADGQFEIDIL